MKTQLMLAHITPHFHSWGAGILLILLVGTAVMAIILASGSKAKDK
jgi:hypothetical protein